MPPRRSGMHNYGCEKKHFSSLNASILNSDTICLVYLIKYLHAKKFKKKKKKI